MVIEAEVEKIINYSTMGQAIGIATFKI